MLSLKVTTDFLRPDDGDGALNDRSWIPTSSCSSLLLSPPCSVSNPSFSYEAMFDLVSGSRFILELVGFNEDFLGKLLITFPSGLITLVIVSGLNPFRALMVDFDLQMVELDNE